MHTIKPGQIREHERSGLRLKVLRRDGRDRWVVAYLPPNVPSRGKNERVYPEHSLISYYPVSSDG